MGRLLRLSWVREMLPGGALLCGAAALILWPQESMEGARDGLSLCYNVIIPSLFPFFVVSTLVVELGLARRLGQVLEPVMRPLFRVSGPCATAVVLGFVGGYPVGARTALTLYRSGACTKIEAQRLLAFCNNSGPAFILGVVGAGVFASGRVGLLLYLAHAAASLCVGLVFRWYGGRGEAPPRIRFGAVSAPPVPRLTVAFTEAVRGSFLAMLGICSFVVFFTVAVGLLAKSGLLAGLAAALARLLAPFGLTAGEAEHLLIGLLELSSGVWSLSGQGALPGQITMAAFLLGWAGLSVHCQVLSFLGESDLSPRTYLAGKLLHGVFSALFAGAFTCAFPLDAPVSVYLARQVADLADLEFSTALGLSAGAAAVVWLVLWLFAAKMGGKNSGNGRRTVV